MILKLTRPLVFLDFESTGLDTATDRIVELAFVRLLPDGHGGLILHLRPSSPAGLKAGDRVGVHLPVP